LEDTPLENESNSKTLNLSEMLPGQMLKEKAGGLESPRLSLASDFLLA
jgi:hypothetical protein